MVCFSTYYNINNIYLEYKVRPSGEKYGWLTDSTYFTYHLFLFFIFLGVFKLVILLIPWIRGTLGYFVHCRDISWVKLGCIRYFRLLSDYGDISFYNDLLKCTDGRTGYMELKGFIYFSVFLSIGYRFRDMNFLSMQT